MITRSNWRLRCHDQLITTRNLSIQQTDEKNVEEIARTRKVPRAPGTARRLSSLTGLSQRAAQC